MVASSDAMTRNDQTLRCLENVSEKESDGNFIELFSHTTWFLRKFIYEPINKKKKESDVFPWTKVNFDGFLMPAPRDWRNILKSYHGDFMRIPYREPPANIIADALQSSEEIVKS